jgi:hypothetical protein
MQAKVARFDFPLTDATRRPWMPSSEKLMFSTVSTTETAAFTSLARELVVVFEPAAPVMLFSVMSGTFVALTPPFLEPHAAAKKEREATKTTAHIRVRVRIPSPSVATTGHRPNLHDL